MTRRCSTLKTSTLMYTKLFQRLFDLTQRREVTSTKKATLKNVEMFAEKAGWEKKKKIKKIKIIQRRYLERT